MSDLKKRILVMDDEEIVADIAKQMLEYLGYEVTTVEDGEQAVEAYEAAMKENRAYALVIMDLNIPNGMGGMEAVQHIRRLDDAARVLVSTGYSSDAIVNDYARYGFSGCIAKPFDLKGLQNAVDHSM